MGRVYNTTGTVASVASTKDLFEIAAPNDMAIVIHEIHVTNDTDETSEMIPLTIQRAGTGGSGGSVVTDKAPMHVGDAASTATVESGNGTQASTLTLLYRLSENILNGWHWVPVPEGRIVISPSGIVVVRLEASPTTAGTYSFSCLYEEVGG